MLNEVFPNPDVLKRLTASSLGSFVQSYATSFTQRNSVHQLRSTESDPQRISDTGSILSMLKLIILTTISLKNS